MNPLFVTGAVLGVSVYGTCAAPASSSPVDSTSIIEAIRRKHELPALAVVVVKDGKICDRAATGVRKRGNPARVTTNDVFHIGSCTKSMTATLAAILIEEGKLRWDTTLAEVFPAMKMNEQYQRVTMQQLLMHRGGCPGEPPAAAWAKAVLEQGEPTQQRLTFIQTLLADAPAAAPGTEYIYSNQGYVVAAAMMEKLTGKSWEALVTEKLFKPLGMKSAGFGAPGTVGGVDQPWGHARALGSTVPLQKDNPVAIGPAGRVHCSLDDLARFVMSHLERGNGPARLLKPETFRRLHTPPEGGDYACGWRSVPRTWARGNALMHSGSNTMWYLVMWLAPEKNFAVIAATNIGGDEAAKGCDDVAGAMLEKWLEK